MNDLARVSVALAVAAGLATGCASGGAAPTVSPRTVELIQPAHVPPPPAGLAPELTEMWTALRTRPTPAVETLWAAVAPDAAAGAEAQSARGFLALRQGDVNGAREAFGAALAAAPDLAVAALGMGLVAKLRNEPELAGDWFEVALDADPTLTRAAVQLRNLELDAVIPILIRAEQAEAAGQDAEAEAAYLEAAERSPSLVGPWLHVSDLRQRRGDDAASIDLLRDARRRTGDDPAVLERLGLLLRDAGRYAEAADILQRLADARPGDARIAALAREARDLYERAALPEEYRNLRSKRVISREDLAALLAINLDPIAAAFGEAGAIIVADATDRWSTPFIRRVVGWDVLDVYQNNDFFPEMQVRRSMLVEACYRVLDALGATADAPRPTLQDPPPEHLLYGPTQAVIGFGLMTPDTDGSFDLLAPVSGAEAIEAVQALAAVVRRYGT